MKARVEQTFAEMAATYGSRLPLFDVFGRELVAVACLQDGERVLDLACGRGACLRPAAEAVGASGRVLGLDLSPQMVRLTAEELRRDRLTNIEVSVGDAEHLEPSDESFDAVICGFAVFLFPEPQRALAEVHRVLRPGGRFASSMFADRVLDYPWVFDALDAAEIDHEFRHRPGSPVATSDGLRTYLQNAGFDRIVAQTTQHRFVFEDVGSLFGWWRAHFLGSLLARLSEPQLARFRHECTRQLEPYRSNDGFELNKSVILTVANRT